MQGQGIITTARGHKLNVNELKAKATRRTVSPTGTITVREPPKPKPLNLRGHQPEMLTQPSPNAQAGMRGEPISQPVDAKEVPSQADFTRMVVKDSPNRKKSTDANAVLDDILGDLQKTTKNKTGPVDDKFD